MRSICSWTDAPALFGLWPRREFVQRTVAQIQGNSGGGLADKSKSPEVHI
jgi:hypothetical protein